MSTTSPAVHCGGCAYDWNSETMVDGLRLIGSCPRCGGSLEFSADASTDAPRETAEQRAVMADGRPAHLVLGMPRGW